ncbi:MAG: hypothetical protein P4L92_11070 [Rudaea sp.]|nr:hypothetical protein [Rudaea sp.]
MKLRQIKVTSPAIGTVAVEIESSWFPAPERENCAEQTTQFDSNKPHATKGKGMKSEHMRPKIHKGAEEIERGVEAAAGQLANGAEAVVRERDALESGIEDIAQRVRDGTKGMSDEIAKQARLHPLATFGVAFAAGLIVARVLRR